MRRAAYRYVRERNPAEVWEDWREIDGCCHGLNGDSASQYMGVIRFASDQLTTAILTHELVHAAIHTYRLVVSRDRVHLNNMPAEECLAYIYSDLAANLFDHFTPGG